MKRLILFFFLFLFFQPGTVFAATTPSTYPTYSGYVNDFAGILPLDYSSQLNAKLTLFTHKTTNQIAVVTVNSTEPETIDEYSIHLADVWKVGQKGKDNGVIMLFAMKDHTMRIEVGRGLEGDLTDVQTKHIQSNLIVPAFKNGQYQQGIESGVNAVINTITHDPNYAASLQTQQQGNTPPASTHSTSSASVIILIIIVLLVLLSLFTPFGGSILWILLSLLTSGGGGSGDSEGGSDGSDTFGGGGFSGGGSSDKW